MKEIFCFLLIASAYSSIVYSTLAEKNNWGKSKFLDKNVIFTLFNWLVLLGAFIEVLYAYKWYMAIFGFLFAAISGYAVTLMLQTDAKYLAPAVTLISLFALAYLNAEFVRP
ncbi:MAG: hypothetical protein M1292_08240 [Bacteroidetes bacterium]|nr:hypothetical protein [Bacteroidota bacterium]